MDAVRPPRVVFRGSDCEAGYERPSFGGFTPSGGGCCCSGMTAEVLAWRWSSWCNTVCLFLVPVNAGSHLKVLDNYTSVDVWWVSWKTFGFAAFVVRSFFVRLELSRADELCGLRRCPNPTSLSC